MFGSCSNVLVSENIRQGGPFFDRAWSEGNQEGDPSEQMGRISRSRSRKQKGHRVGNLKEKLRKRITEGVPRAFEKETYDRIINEAPVLISLRGVIP